MCNVRGDEIWTRNLLYAEGCDCVVQLFRKTECIHESITVFLKCKSLFFFENLVGFLISIILCIIYRFQVIARQNEISAEVFQFIRNLFKCEF